ncbi:MAG: hypothetical protein IK072_01915 [Clostridia bacterium]|nr:hypothetical protein [Clostridia bacterium]
MNKKTIKIELSEKGIERAIKELEQYEKDLKKKINLLKEKVAEFIASKAGAGFLGAISDDLLPGSGGPRYANVDVTIKQDGDIFIVIANGSDAVWVEFGAGVYHNGPVGSSPNPLGAKLGFSIGGYGKNKGKRDTWGFKDDSGERFLTHGTPASMPMYKALESATEDLRSIVREVFDGND